MQLVPLSMSAETNKTIQCQTLNDKKRALKLVSLLKITIIDRTFENGKISKTNILRQAVPNVSNLLINVLAMYQWRCVVGVR